MISFKELSQMFNRAITHAFGVSKFLCLFSALFLSGLIFLFFQALAIGAPDWLKWPLRCIPMFVIFGFLMAAGAVLIKVYAKERDAEEAHVKRVFLNSWELVLKSSYFALPLLLAFLVFWILLGLFLLIKAIPYLGTLVGIVLAFIPYLLILAVLLLFLVALGTFFFILPPLAVGRPTDRKTIFHNFGKDIFSNLILLAVAFVPVWIVWLFAGKAMWLTFEIYSFDETPIATVLQSFFILIPFFAVMTPAINFFFNFSVEANIRMTGEFDSEAH